MLNQLCRTRRLIAVAAIAWSGTAGAAAQAPDQRSMTTPSLAVVMAQVPVGDVVYVTDATGATIKGPLAAVTDDAVQVFVRGGLRHVPASDVRRIQWRSPDSPLTGALIGAGIGAIPGIYWLVVDPNECTGMCPEEYAAIAICAGIGWVIDRAVHRKVTVYVAGASSGGAGRAVVGPLVTRDRRGVQVAVRF